MSLWINSIQSRPASMTEGHHKALADRRLQNYFPGGAQETACALEDRML